VVRGNGWNQLVLLMLIITDLTINKMKKLTMSVAALVIAISSFGQVDSTYVSKEAKKAEKTHKNLYTIVNNAEDMLFQLQLDADSGFILDGMSEFYEELLKEIIKLAAKTEISSKDINYQKAD
jgi:CTP:phosphocholine cytidylyltransferase-like protein